LAAAIAARQGVAELNKRRSAEQKPTTDMYLGLHVGEVFYGNVGSRERLDFTVLGPAVNEASRIAAMCRSVDQPILLSAAFAEASAPFGGTLCFARRIPTPGAIHDRLGFVIALMIAELDARLQCCAASATPSPS
jgi:adenylate cyclase